MAQSIVVPSGDRLEFPDGMPDSEIEKAIHAEYPDLAPKPSLMSRAGAALKPAEREPMPSAADTINAGWTSPAEERLSVPGSVMDQVPVAKMPATDPGAIDAQGVPMTREFMNRVRRQMDAAAPEQRAILASRPDNVGRAAAEILRQQQDIDQTASSGEALTGKTAAIRALDTRKEARSAALARQGLDPQYAAGVAEQDAARDGDQMLGGVDASSFDFDTAAAYKDANPITRGAAAGVTELGKQGVAIHTLINEALGRDEMADKGRAAWESLGRKSEAINNDSSIDVTTRKGSAGKYLGESLGHAVTSVITNAPGLALSFATGGGGAGLMLMAGQVGADEVLNGRKRGLSNEEALARGVIYGWAEAVGEKFGLDSFKAFWKEAAKGVKTSDLPAFLASHLKKEIPGELLTTNIQYGTDVGYGLEKPSLERYLRQNVDTVVQTLMQGGMMSAGGVVLQKSANAIRPEQDLTAGVQFNPDAIDAYARQQLDPANAQMRQVGARAAPVQPPASPRAELAAVLSGNQPVAEILAAQAPAAPQTTPQAPLQPAAFGWPDIKTPAVATLPDGQIITGQIAGIQDSDGQPMARFVGADGQVWMIQPGEADIKPAPAAAKRQRKSAFVSSQQFSVDTEDNGKFDVTVHRTASGDVVVNHPDGLMEYKAAFANGKTDAELLAYGFEPFGFRNAAQAPAGNGTRTAPVQAETAEHVKIAEQAVNTEPSEAQKEAGNYQLGHLAIQGLDIAIENPAGSVRSGVDKAGKPWANTLNHTYGYIKGATAADGDKLDAFIGPDPQSQQVFVIDQIDPDTGRYDEGKVMLGFASEQEAHAAYLSNYNQGWKGVGAITPLSMPAFKAWIAKGATHKPLAYDQKAAIAERKTAADTQKAGEAYAAEREKAVAAIGEDQVAAIEDQVADQNAGQPTIELYRAIATALKAEAARQATQPAAQPVQTPSVPSAQPEPVAAAAPTKKQLEMKARADARNQEGTTNAAQKTAENPLPAVQEEARQGSPLPEQVANAAPVPAVAGEGSDRGAVGRQRKKAFVSSETYSVDTEDSGKFDVTVHRTATGDVVINHPDGLIEHKAEFANGKADTDLLAYDFEPVGFRNASPAAQPVGTTPKVGAGTTAQQSPEASRPNPVAESQAPAPSEPGDDGVATIQGGAAADTIAGKPVADMSDDQLRTIARGLSPTYGEAAVDKAKTEINRRNAALREATAVRGEVGASLTKEQRKAVMQTLTDVYKIKNAPKESKGLDQNGNERVGYAYSPELFEKSDITGAPIRYVVTLPDGRIAHPTELFPDMTLSRVEALILEQQSKERDKAEQDKFRREQLERRKSDTINEANGKFNRANPGLGLEFVPALLTDGKQFIRTHPDSVANDLRLLGGDWVEKPVGVAAAPSKVGDVVKLTKPGVNGRINIAGTVTKILPDGRIEVRTQQDGYMTVAESDLGHKPKVGAGTTAQQSPEASRPNPVAESQAPAPSEPGDGGVAPTLDKAAPAPADTLAAQGRQDIPAAVPRAQTVTAPPQGEASQPEERAYTKGQAEVLARRMTNQGLPSEAYPHPTQAGMWAIRVPGEEHPADAGADFLASNRAEFRHEGFRIYPISIKGEPRWAVQSLDNSEKEKKGERQIGGDAIVNTPEQAKQQAESQVTERSQKAEDQRQFAEHAAADEAKKEANRGLSITQRRANAALDKPTNLPVNAGVGRGTRREAMESAVSQERAITAVDVRDQAAYKRDEDEQGRLHRAGYGAFFGNDSHPQKMRFNELTAKLKNRDNYQKKEYRLYMGRDTEGSFYDITKTEYDYAQTLIATKKAEASASATSTPMAKKEPESLVPRLDVYDREFQRYLDKGDPIESAHNSALMMAGLTGDGLLRARTQAGGPATSKPGIFPRKGTQEAGKKEPWQYGELEYGDKYIDEVVLPQLRKDLENAHGGKFQEYKSKAAAVRGLKERIDTLENHRDAKARKYYASLDDHYAAVRRALAAGKDVPPVAYESYDDLKADVSAGRIKGDGQEVARMEQPQHIEAGQAEPATAPVIAASIKESAKNTPMNIEQAREWLLGEIDKAIIDAKSAAEEDVWDRAEGKVDLKGRMDVKETIGYKVFDVPGDGRFSVLNLKESLQKFKKQVAATPGFKKNATRPMSVANGSGGKTSVRDMLEDGEYVLAADYGRLIGEPLLFGAVRKGEAHPIAYTNAEPVDIKGIEAQVGREWNVTGKSFSWRVIETTTGVSVSSETTKERAVSKAKAYVDEHGADKLIAQIKETPKVSQSELERQFTDWGSEEEAKAQKTRDAVERADTEDRALWNSIFPLKDGEKRSPNPWNDIDHMQVVILAKDAAKAGKGDEFVSLIERRRGGTNNMLALAARKALADAAPKAKPAKGSIATGVASKILGDIYQRAAYNKWTWDRLKSYLTREMEEAGVGKSRMANALEKAMTEYARTANGRLGYPNSNLVFSAMRDYGLIAEDAAAQAKAEPAKGYPFYSNNKLFNAEGTAELPKDWTGVARSDSGKRFFYLGQENGERSFNPLKAESYEDALKEAEGLKNDKPVIPEGYREVARGYFGGTVEKPIYAPFSEGERVRFIGGHAGQIQSFIGGPVTTGAIIKYDNGLTGRAEWRDVEAVKKPAAEQEPKNFKSIDALNAANNPLGEDDWIRFADGSEWQVKGRMNGWVLMQGKTEHPTVKNIMGQVQLIRAVIEANDAAQKPKEPAFDVDAEGGHSWNVIKAHSEWVKLAKNQWHYRFEGMGQGVVIDTHAEEGRSGENKWRTSDGELHVGLAEAKAHEIETHAKPKLIENGYLNEAAQPKPKTIAEASLGDLLRAAADKADGKAAPEAGKPVATKEPAQGAENSSETAKESEFSTSTLNDLRDDNGTKGVWLGDLTKNGESFPIRITHKPTNRGDWWFDFYADGKVTQSLPFPRIKGTDTAGKVIDDLMEYVRTDSTDKWGFENVGQKHADILTRAATSDQKKFDAEMSAMRKFRGDTESHPWDDVDLKAMREYNEIAQARFKTASQEKWMQLLEQRIKGNPAKWKIGDGIGYKVNAGGVGTQTNRGFRIVEIDKKAKTAVIRQVADTGLTSSGGNNDRIGSQEIPIGELVRDRKYDAQGAEKVSAGTTATKERFEYPNPKYTSPSDLPAMRAVVDYMNGDITRDAMTQIIVDSGLPEGTIRSITNRLGEDSYSYGEIADIKRRQASAKEVGAGETANKPDTGIAFNSIEAPTFKANKLSEKDATHVDFERVEELGETTNLREAGYIFDDGRLLDLSGKREGGPPGERGYDHREVGGNMAMQEFIALGNIRMDMASGTMDIGAEPTPAQESVIRQIATKHNGELVIDLEDGLGAERDGYYSKPARNFSQEYPRGTKPERILADIRRFFAGEMPVSLSPSLRSLEDDHQSAVSRAIDRAIAQESEQPTETQRGAGWLKIKLRQAQHKGDLSAKAVEMVEWLVKQNPALVKYLAVAVENPKELMEGGFNAPISDATRAKRIFHSTSTEAAALKILEDGEIRPPDNKHARGKLAPVVGRTYVSPSLETASIYSLGGVMMGRDYNWQGRTDRAAGQYGYIFEIDPSSYGDVQPDEDSVGELAANAMRDANRNSELRWLADLAQNLGTPNQIRDAKFGEYAALAQLGKKLVKHMSDAQKTLLIDKHDAHIANQGPLKIARAWKVDKSKAKEIARDGSNVLDVAEQVYGEPFNDFATGTDRPTGAAGNYNPFTQVMTLFRGNASDTTAVHEILHHLERMMPAEMQAEIRKEWRKAATKELLAATKAKDQKRIAYFTAVLAGDQKKATELLTGKGMEGFNAPSFRVVDLFGNGSRVQHFDDRRGLFYESQKYPSGKVGWRAGEVVDGQESWLSAKEFDSMEEAQKAVRGLRISNTAKQNAANKYGAIPSLWRGEERRVAKAIIDAGIAVDRFSSSTQSKSKYLFLESGVKVRLADHALPSSYDQADVDYRYGGDVPALIAEIKQAEQGNVGFNAVEPAPTFKPVDTESAEFGEFFGDSKAVDVKGEPLRVYHGSKEMFDAFDPAFAEREDSWSFSSDIDVARTYQPQNIDPAKVWEIYQALDAGDKKKFDKEFDSFRNDDGEVDRESVELWAEEANNDDPQLWAGDLADSIGKRASVFYGKADGQMVEAYLSLQNPIEYWYDSKGNIIKTVKPDGEHDGYIHHNAMDTNDPRNAWIRSTVYQVLKPTQIKSAVKNTGAYSRTNPSIYEDLAIGTDYQYLNPSEFWAVRMTNTAASRFKADTLWKKTVQWLREALEHIKGALGLKSDHPLLKAFDELIKHGTGEFQSTEMLGSSEVYASIEESGPEEVTGTIMRDASLAARLLLHPRQIAANHKPFVPVFDTAIKQFEERDRIVSGLGEMAKPYFDLTHAQRLNVNKIVEQGRLDRTVYTVADLENGIHHAESGDLVTLDAEEIGAYKSLRKTFNEALSLFRDTMLEEFGFAELIPEQKAAMKLRQMIADGEIEESRIEWARHVAKAIDEIEQAKRTGYAPFNRYGQFVVAVKALPAGVEVQEDDGKQLVTGIPEYGDDPLTQIVTDLGGQYDVFRDGWVIDDTRKAVLRALETTLFATKVEVNAFNEWRKQGKDVTAIPEVKAAFDEARRKYGKAPNARVLAFHITEKAKADDANLSTFDELARISDVDVETWDAVREKLQEAIKAKSFRKHFFGSDNTPGYSVDFERSVADYIIGMSGYLARRKHVKDFDNAIKRIKAPALAKYAEDYRKYVNAPADEFALLKNIGFLYYIAGSTATAVANLTQVPIMTTATLKQFVPHHIVAREVSRAWGETLAMFSPTKTGLQMFDPAKVPADVRDVFKAAWEDQLFVPLETLDLMAASSIKTVGGRRTMRALSVTTQAIAYMFMFAERLNRITTFIAAARISRMKVAKDRMRDVVKNDAWARHSIGGRAWGERNFAEWAVDESQYRMGKVNRPTVMRGVGSPLLQFKGYMIQTLEAGYRMAVMHGKGGKPAALAALAMMLMLGGLWVLPGLEDLRDMIEKLYKASTGKDLDLKTEVRQLIARTTGSASLAAATNKGIPYATVGVDMSRVGMGNILPDSALQVGGIPVDLAIARPMRAAEKMAAGKTTEAMSEFLPNFLKNPAMGLQWKRDGLRDKYGSRMMTPGEFDYGDVAIKSLGWTPTKVTNRREYTYAESRAERGIDELKRRYTNDLVRAYVHEAEAKDPAEKAEYKADQVKILARIDEHNKTASPENLIKLDPGTLRRKAAAEFSGSAAREGKERKLSRGAAQDRRELFQLGR